MTQISKHYLRWKIIFLASLLLSIFELYNMFTMPDILRPTHPTFISVFILLIDVFCLIASFGVAFERRYFNALLWKVIIVVQLGRVDLSRSFLQQFVCHLYKTEQVKCGYSTRNCDNAV